MVQNLMTGGASIEDTLALWAASLREAKRRIRPLFTQDRVAMSAGQFLDALLGNEPRKTGWMRAEAAGDVGPWRQRQPLARLMERRDRCCRCSERHCRRSIRCVLEAPVSRSWHEGRAAL